MQYRQARRTWPLNEEKSISVALEEIDRKLKAAKDRLSLTDRQIEETGRRQHEDSSG
jgi:hypothetical protein